MKCHYDVLKLSKECTDDEIKKSYRKLALQYHPDKNPDRVEECTREFHLVQQAYDVLIDPQERAWYDQHREAILKGGLGHGDKYQDNCLDVYQFFNASCYSGFGDDVKGFYSVYSDVFRKISLEDEEYMDNVVKAPDFGNSSSSYEEVVSMFYGHWESYCTCKSYVWVEKYDTREAPNRQIRRLMEQDNKKLCDKARRERNDEVRALVAFVRKRDRRVQAYKKRLEVRAAEIKQFAEEKRLRDRRQRRKNLDNYVESEWSSMSGLQQQLRQLEMNVVQQFGDSCDDDDDNDDDNDLDAESVDVAQDKVDAAAAAVNDDDKHDDDLYCIACKKAFKSLKAMENHNRSRKHVDNLSRLLLQLNDDDDGGDDDDEEADACENDSHDGQCHVVNGQALVTPDTLCYDDVDSDIIDNPLTTNESRSRSKKQKKRRRQRQKQADVSQTAHTQVEVDSRHRGTDESVGSNTIYSVDHVSQPQCTSKSPTDDDRRPSCHVCRQMFASRNKLFEHIKSTGHALRIATPDTNIPARRDRKKQSSTRKKC